MKKLILPLLLLSSLIPSQSEAKLLHARGFGTGFAIGQYIFWQNIFGIGKDLSYTISYKRPRVIPSLIISSMTGILGEIIYSYRHKKNLNIKNNLSTLHSDPFIKALNELSLEEISLYNIPQNIRTKILNICDTQELGSINNKLLIFKDLKKKLSTLQKILEINIKKSNSLILDEIKKYIHMISIVIRTLKESENFHQQISRANATKIASTIKFFTHAFLAHVFIRWSPLMKY